MSTLLTICALRGVDPVALVRKFERIGTLRFAHSTMLDGRTLALCEGRSGDMQMGVWVDPSTSIPLQIRTRVPLLQPRAGLDGHDDPDHRLRAVAAEREI